MRQGIVGEAHRHGPSRAFAERPKQSRLIDRHQGHAMVASSRFQQNTLLQGLDRVAKSPLQQIEAAQYGREAGVFGVKSRASEQNGFGLCQARLFHPYKAQEDQDLRLSRGGTEARQTKGFRQIDAPGGQMLLGLPEQTGLTTIHGPNISESGLMDGVSFRESPCRG